MTASRAPRLQEPRPTDQVRRTTRPASRRWDSVTLQHAGQLDGIPDPGEHLGRIPQQFSSSGQSRYRARVILKVGRIGHHRCRNARSGGGGFQGAVSPIGVGPSEDHVGHGTKIPIAKGVDSSHPVPRLGSRGCECSGGNTGDENISGVTHRWRCPDAFGLWQVK
jgi:hypothetical protein